jgi:hypothetical protein
MFDGWSDNELLDMYVIQRFAKEAADDLLPDDSLGQWCE